MALINFYLTFILLQIKIQYIDLQYIVNCLLNSIYPAIDIFRSGTRREELLVSEEEREKVVLLRRHLTNMSPFEAMEFILDKIKGTRDNLDFLVSMNKR